MHWLIVLDRARNECKRIQVCYPLQHTGLGGSFHIIDSLLCGDLHLEDLRWYTTSASPTNSLDHYLL